jgi:GST-like protein
VTLFESGSILTYLSEKYDELMPRDKLMKAITTNWLFFGCTAVSPHFKLFGFYFKYCSHGIPYCVERYTKEVHRELQQMEYQLQRHGKHWFIGDMYTVADISMWPWVHQLFVNYDNAGEVVFDIPHQYPMVFAWYNRCLSRPASKRALDVCMIQFDT